MSEFQPSRPLEPNPPLDTSKGTVADEVSSARLLAYLDAVAPLEDLDERGKREMLLNDLNTLLKEWIRELAVAKGIYADYESAAEAGGRLFISGSYRLGINSPDGDVDTVAVCPEFVLREDFFAGQWLDKLRSYPDVEHLNSIADALVPIIELKIAGCDVDMGFARVQAPTVGRSINILDDNVLRGVERSDMIALNGPRVTELLHRLVPNYASFSVVVRTLRLWAKQRGIYSNKMGYLGGVNFNLLAAFICQLYPNMPPAAIVYRFFVVFANWFWPKPVSINKAYRNAALGWDHEVFDADDVRNRSAFMPVITPAYPQSNSLYNVNLVTLKIIHEEFQRGLQASFTVMKNPDANTHDWSAVFAPSEFFLRFDSYLILDISASSEADLLSWKGWVEAKVRLLVTALEGSGLPLNSVFPFPKTFERFEVIPEEEIAAAAAKAAADVAAAAGGDGSEADAAGGTAAMERQEPALDVSSLLTGATTIGAPSRDVSDAGTTVSQAEPHEPTGTGTGSAMHAGMKRPASMISAAATPTVPHVLPLSRGTREYEYEEEEEEDTGGAAASIGQASGTLLSDVAVGDEDEDLLAVAGDLDTVAEGQREVEAGMAGTAHCHVAQCGPVTLPTHAQLDSCPLLAVKEEAGQEGQKGALPGTVVVHSSSSAAEDTPVLPHLPHGTVPTAVAASSPVMRHVYSIFVGLEPDRERLKRTALNLTPVLRTFKLEKVYSWRHRKEGMAVRQRVLKWAQLPDDVFADGRELAEVQRVAVKERFAKEAAAMAAARDESIKKAQASRVFVRNPSAGAGGSTDVAPPAALPAQPQPVGQAPAPLQPGTSSSSGLPPSTSQRRFVSDPSQSALFSGGAPVAGGSTVVGVGGRGGIPGLGSAWAGSGAIKRVGGGLEGQGRESYGAERLGAEGAAKRKAGASGAAPVALVQTVRQPSVAAFPVSGMGTVGARPGLPSAAGSVIAAAQAQPQAKKFRVQLLGK